MCISTDIEKNSLVSFINIGGIMQVGDLVKNVYNPNGYSQLWLVTKVLCGDIYIKAIKTGYEMWAIGGQFEVVNESR
jgi:hypothetical protein